MRDGNSVHGRGAVGLIVFFVTLGDIFLTSMFVFLVQINQLVTSVTIALSALSLVVW